VHVNFSFHFFLFDFHYKKFLKDSGLVETESCDETSPPTETNQNDGCGRVIAEPKSVEFGVVISGCCSVRWSCFFLRIGLLCFLVCGVSAPCSGTWKIGVEVEPCVQHPVDSFCFALDIEPSDWQRLWTIAGWPAHNNLPSLRPLV
jgi:hypothetical protein